MNKFKLILGHEIKQRVHNTFHVRCIIDQGTIFDYGGYLKLHRPTDIQFEHLNNELALVNKKDDAHLNGLYRIVEEGNFNDRLERCLAQPIEGDMIVAALHYLGTVKILTVIKSGEFLQFR